MHDILFLLKKVFSLAVYPLYWSLLLFFLGIIVLLRRKGSHAGLALILTGTLSLLFFSLHHTAFSLLNPLETQAGVFQEPSDLERQGVKFIVVMGGSIVEDGFPPAESWGPSILRVMEGIRLAGKIRDCKLVLSGGAVPDRQSAETAMSRLPLEMGISRESLIIMTTAFDSDDEARAFAALVGKQPFGLVTSARHMPRSLRLFNKYGANPIPCPSDFKTLQEASYHRKYIPSVDNLSDSHSAIHEYVGIFWMDLKQRLLEKYSFCPKSCPNETKIENCMA